MCRVIPRNKNKSSQGMYNLTNQIMLIILQGQTQFLKSGISCRDFYCTAAVISPGIMRKHPLSISRLFLVVFFNYRLNRKQKKDKMTKREGESGKLTSRNSMPKRGAFAAKTYIVPIRLSQKQNYYHKSLMEFFNECQQTLVQSRQFCVSKM